jgi:ribosomal protein S27E
MVKFEAANPPHPAVDWERTESRAGSRWVAVTCPGCHAPHLERAKSVRYRIKMGRFTGLCRKDGRPRPSGAAAFPPHPAVHWDSLRIRDGIQCVLVACPVCGDSRELEAKAVRNQLRRGTFTGRCFHDRLIAKAQTPRPAPVGFDWEDRQVITEAGGRRRTMVRIRCPHCDAVRLGHPSHVARAIEAGTFRAECAFHRRNRQLSPRAKVKILQFVLLTDTTGESIERLRHQVEATPPRRATG